MNVMWGAPLLCHVRPRLPLLSLAADAGASSGSPGTHTAGWSEGQVSARWGDVALLERLCWEPLHPDVHNRHTMLNRVVHRPPPDRSCALTVGSVVIL
jgi:hypothetical protein